jgi:TRAP-type C4-dicarboxylate transport system substrate-binding protein
MRIGLPNALNTPSGEALQALKAQIEEQSGGSITVSLFPSLQLGTIVEQMEGVQAGTQQAMLVTPGWFTRFYAGAGVLDLPFLVPDWESYERLLASEPLQRLKQEAGAATNVKIVAVLADGFKNIANDERSLKTPEDFEGLRIRIQDSQIGLATWQAFNANPIILGWGETYEALQSGIVDALDTSLPNMRSMKIQEVAPYISQTQANLVAFFVAFDESFYDDLTDDEKAVVDKAFQDAEAFVLKHAREVESQAAADLAAVGATVEPLSAEGRAALRAIVQPVYDQFGPDLEPMLSEITAAISGG